MPLKAVKADLKKNLIYKHYKTSQINIHSNYIDSSYYSSNHIYFKDLEKQVSDEFGYIKITSDLNIRKIKQPIMICALSFNFNKAEILVYYPSSNLLNQLADKFIQQVDSNNDSMQIIFEKLNNFSHVVLSMTSEEALHGSSIKEIDFTKNISIPVNNIETYIKNASGCCRHYAILLAHILNVLMDRKILPEAQLFFNFENLDLINSTYNERHNATGHAWLLYKPNDLSYGVWSLDGIWNQCVNLDDKYTFENLYGGYIRNSLIRRHHLQAKSDVSQAVTNPKEHVLEKLLVESGLSECGNIRVIIGDNDITFHHLNRDIKLIFASIFKAFLLEEVNPIKQHITIQTDDTFYNYITEHYQEICLQLSKVVDSYLFYKTLNTILLAGGEGIKKFYMDVLLIDNILYLDAKKGEGLPNLMTILGRLGFDVIILSTEAKFNLFDDLIQIAIYNPDVKKLIENLPEITNALGIPQKNLEFIEKQRIEFK